MGLLKKLLKKIHNFIFSYGGKSINNVSANYIFAPFYVAIMTHVLHKYYKIPLWNGFNSSILETSIGLSFISGMFYMYVSTFFQPDLDNTPHRPGKHSFPFGARLIEVFKFGKAIRMVFRPITVVWYYLWEPFAQLATHRGITHWPIIGVWLRVYYLTGVFRIIEWTCIQLDYYSVPMLYFDLWLKAFFPWNKGFLSTGFLLFCLPVYISDIVHSAVDLIDSNRKGLTFCPPQIRRGIVNKMIRGVRNLPKTARDHYSDFL